MAAKNPGYRKTTGAELRAQRIARETGPSPAEEARHRERKLLDGLGGAAEDLEWLATNQAWALLGHETCAAWWAARVKPVAESLGFEPSRELGMRFVELIRAEEAALPTTQRRSTKELAAFVGVSEWAARRRQDQRQRRSAPKVDHDGPVIDSTFREGGQREIEPAAEPDPSHLVDAVNQMLTDAADRAGVDDDEEAERETLPAEAWRCEECNHGLAEPFVRKGERRCINCDADRTHVAAQPGGACLTCSGSGDGASPVAGSGPQERTEEVAHAFVGDRAGHNDLTCHLCGQFWSRPIHTDSPAADDQLTSPHAGVPAAGVNLSDYDSGAFYEFEERIEDAELIGCPLCGYAVEVSDVDPDTSLSLVHDHLRHSHILTTDEALTELARVRTISPAADEMPHIPTAGASPTLAPQQPGQDSPTGQGRVSQEGRAAEAPDRSETDSSAGPDREGRPASTGPSIAVATTVLPGVGHHEPDAGSGSGEAPEAAASVEPGELEDGDAAVTPSSSDPELLLQLFAAILQALDRVDVGALAPLLLTGEMEQLHEAADRVATFVGLLETWRTP